MKDTEMTNAELAKVQTEIAKMMAEIQKIGAETSKINRESRWYPVAVASSLIGAGAAMAAVLIKFF